MKLPGRCPMAVDWGLRTLPSKRTAMVPSEAQCPRSSQVRVMMNALRSGRRSRRQASSGTAPKSAGGEYGESRRRVDELLEILPGSNLLAGAAEFDDGYIGVGQAFDLADADTGGEELAEQVVPRRADEFVCSRCFLIQHRSRLANSSGERVCADCC